MRYFPFGVVAKVLKSGTYMPTLSCGHGSQFKLGLRTSSIRVRQHLLEFRMPRILLLWLLLYHHHGGRVFVKEGHLIKLPVIAPKLSTPIYRNVSPLTVGSTNRVM